VKEKIEKKKVESEASEKQKKRNCMALMLLFNKLLFKNISYNIFL